LSTLSKAFCGCSTEFGQTPNSLTCPVCLGFPGSLPVLNKKALEYAIKVALALNCRIANVVKFDRKNYYYPDLPKNFQISQYDQPLSYNGFIDVEIGEQIKRIGIRRVHLEEDAGKLLHEGVKGGSWVDFNRSGTPLLEIVSEPDLNSGDEAYQYLNQLKNLLKFLDVSDCNMEEGSLRCDANISLRPQGVKELGVKIELKNMNSFRAVREALDYEAVRQEEVLKEGGKLIQETRLWNQGTGNTVSMRSKEEAQDYRYFPEPDLVPLIIDQNEVKEIEKSLPELPYNKRKRFIEEIGLSKYDAFVLTSEKSLCHYFEDCLKIYNKPKELTNWLMGEVMAILKDKNIELDALKNEIKPEYLIGLIKLIENGTISGKMAKELLPEIIATKKPPSELIKEKGLSQISSESELLKIIEQVIAQNQQAVSDFKKGREKSFIFLIGQVMKLSKGAAHPEKVNKILKEKLDGSTPPFLNDSAHLQ
jgi:aspartyl-tRNA(Asn)/glutamyl-tRNA(Gln) amidotransferase subunit B